MKSYLFQYIVVRVLFEREKMSTGTTPELGTDPFAGVQASASGTFTPEGPSKGNGSVFKCFVAAVILVLLILVLMNAYALWPSKERASNGASDLEIVKQCTKNSANKLGLERAQALTGCVADAKRARDAQERYTAAVANVNNPNAHQPTNNYVDIPNLNATDVKSENMRSGRYMPTGGVSGYSDYQRFRERSPYNVPFGSYGPPRYEWVQHYDSENLVSAEAREHAQGIRAYLNGAEKMLGAETRESLKHNGPAGRAMNPLLEKMNVQQELKSTGDKLKKTVQNVGSVFGVSGAEKATDNVLTALARGGKAVANSLGRKSEKAAGGLSKTETSLLLQSGLQ